MKILKRHYLKMIILPCLVLYLTCLMNGCGRKIIIVPDDRELKPVQGDPDRVSISKGYLQQIYDQLKNCK